MHDVLNNHSTAMTSYAVFAVQVCSFPFTTVLKIHNRLVFFSFWVTSGLHRIDTDGVGGTQSEKRTIRGSTAGN